MNNSAAGSNTLTKAAEIISGQSSDLKGALNILFTSVGLIVLVGLGIFFIIMYFVKQVGLKGDNADQHKVEAAKKNLKNGLLCLFLAICWVSLLQIIFNLA
ncbi:hypothetical protein [Mycoplasmopsis glycophila]|uniref:Uncharacterized protein n=1 Tax=Mycoplasmopsis glycophila TaxID=171285 RepID=A0A449AVN9_9BACT|nr:hypothetical protein [Mycoplasmopsis glycophila]VEU70341.1 Uncharacterised protein [Mycoplasmopsis glycophila]VEU70632.1 Uncharacterised protein [Mycoplasmopsis glycophila]